MAGLILHSFKRLPSTITVKPYYTQDAYSPTYYIDECPDSDDFIKSLQETGLEIIRHQDILRQGGADEVWIKAVSERWHLVAEVVVADKGYPPRLFIVACHFGQLFS